MPISGTVARILSQRRAWQDPACRRTGAPAGGQRRTGVLRRQIVVNLKDGEDMKWSSLVFTVPGSTAGCRLWPTGRGNDLRNGYVPTAR